MNCDDTVSSIGSQDIPPKRSSNKLLDDIIQQESGEDDNLIRMEAETFKETESSTQSQEASKRNQRQKMNEKDDDLSFEKKWIQKKAPYIIDFLNKYSSRKLGDDQSQDIRY